MSTTGLGREMHGEAAYTNKKRAHARLRAKLGKVARELGLATDQRDIRTNMGGPAVSGETILHTDTLYVCVEPGTCMGPGFEILFRTCKGRKDYTGGGNNFARLSLLDDPKKAAETFSRVITEMEEKEEEQRRDEKRGLYPQYEDACN